MTEKEIQYSIDERKKYDIYLNDNPDRPKPRKFNRYEGYDNDSHRTTISRRELRG